MAQYDQKNLLNPIFVLLGLRLPCEYIGCAVQIWGMIPMGANGFALDIFSPFTINRNGIADNLKVQVVDSDDRFYDAAQKQSTRGASSLWSRLQNALWIFDIAGDELSIGTHKAISE